MAASHGLRVQGTKKKINCCIKLAHSVFTSIYLIYYVQCTTKNCFKKSENVGQQYMSGL